MARLAESLSLFYDAGARRFAVFGLFSLWSARRALAEAISWRSRATWGLVAGLLLMWAWTTALGVPPLMGIAALLLVLLMALTFARLRIDGGLPIVGMPQIVGYLFFVILGTRRGGILPTRPTWVLPFWRCLALR